MGIKERERRVEVFFYGLFITRTQETCVRALEDSPSGAAGFQFDLTKRTARVFNIPMGISWVNTASSLRKRAVEYKDATVLEIIEDIARTEPGYEVRIANNVVHVATTDVPFSQKFLNVNIPQFSGTGVAAVIKAGLWELLNQQIAPNPPKGYAASIFQSPSDPKLDMQFTNATVEEILDAIAVASEEKVRVVTFSEDQNPTPTGFRRTASLLRKRLRQITISHSGISSYIGLLAG